MPVYLCKPGVFSNEPWRHGIPVYAEPFAMSTPPTNPPPQQPRESSSLSQQEEESRANYPHSEASSLTGVTPHPQLRHQQQHQQEQQQPQPDDSKAIRRIRHSEVVLVDDVVLVYQNYWLKLRWPGSTGGFAGYVCLVGANKQQPSAATDASARLVDGRGGVAVDEAADPAMGGANTDEPPTQRPPETLRMASPNASPANIRPNAGGDSSRAPSPGFYEANSDSDEQTMRCLRTGIVFPSSPALQLLSNYEDGLVPPVALPVEGQQPVFCRICRDGMHDDDDQQQESPGDNPLLAPCECSGSMAFVHYLCVEQWRCRSRHPEARNGTHCETCSKPYALPPPASRPVSQVEEEWLEAMPPHVMAALRQPHFGWQMGAALVRRRWLRPMAPILLSPMVALYCRARRLLKKRGVSRRRWACSLCRRRARWKCVRCLRSYYCSRQCQNVSWHIVHKHVCYKPSRFWWSVVVYSAILLFMIPGILKDPLLYDLALAFIPPSFYIMAVLGGGLATFLKKTAGIDLRGRLLELVVVLCTSWLVYVSWGIMWGFFGSPESCVGAIHISDHEDNQWVSTVQRFVLNPARTYFIFWDGVVSSYERLETIFCSSSSPTSEQDQQQYCFPYISQASPERMLESPSCAGDLQLVTGLWLAAGVTLVASSLLKKRRRGRPHQD